MCFPVVGVVLGIIFLSEPLTWNMIVGSILVVSGIVVVNRKPRVGGGSGRRACREVRA